MNEQLQQEIIAATRESLQQSARILFNWHSKPEHKEELDGEALLTFGNHEVRLNALVRNEIRTYHLPTLVRQGKEHDPFTLIVRKLYPKLRDKLRKEGVNYLEANGNIFLSLPSVYILIDGRPELPPEKGSVNRAFTKTGLKVVFQLLLDKELIDHPQREIAARSGVALGNIPNVIRGLLTENFILKRAKNAYLFNDRKALLERWMTDFESTLKPTLYMGSFRRMDGGPKGRGWRSIPLEYEKTQWGGEPAGELLTEYLRAENLSLYTVETKRELIKRYRLAPDPEGRVKVWRRFWNPDGQEKTVPPLLVYADLMNTGDRRCMETAEMIYNKHVEPIL